MITADILGERARLTPEKAALVYVPTQERFTYGQLDERAIRCARLWTEVCGLRQGDRAGILAHNSVEFLDAVFAAAKAGIILVPLSTRLTPRELEYILRDSGLTVLHYEAEFRETVELLRRAVPQVRWVALDQRLETADLLYREATAALPILEELARMPRVQWAAEDAMRRIQGRP